MVLLFSIFFLLILISWIGLSKMFVKAGQKGYQAFIPFLNFYIWLKLIGKPTYWIFLLFVPIINVFICAYMHIDIVRSFGRESLGDHTLAILAPFYLFLKIGFDPNSKYIAKATDLPKIEKSKNREWTEAIVFAVVAATLIRWLLLEAFTIPTPSMENSLLVGDYLFVSKVHYGARTVKTPLQLPLTHQTIWFTQIPSYLDWIQLPQKRLPAISEVKRGDVVVFNYPPEFQHPTDLKTNYIKRCVAQAGDTLEVKNRNIWINGSEIKLPEGVQFNYYVKFKPDRISNYNFKSLLNKFHKYEDKDISNIFKDGLEISLRPDEAEQIQKLDYVASVTFEMPFQRNPVLYPYNPKFNWTQDNYGAIYVPKKGDKIAINPDNIVMYELPISKYEGNKDVSIQGNKLYIDGKEVVEYEFKQNYYFMMGDNRHNSADSRYWGFVPEDHVVGKAVFIWMSIDKNEKFLNKIRWNRLFTVIK